MNKTCPFSLKPEYVDEMTVAPITEAKHKAMCVRTLLGSSYSQEELETYCNLYGITLEIFGIVFADSVISTKIVNV